MFFFLPRKNYFALKASIINSGEVDSVLVLTPIFVGFFDNQVKSPKVMLALGICVEINYQIVLIKVSF